MNRFLKRFFVGISLILLPVVANAQVSYGGTPPGFSMTKTLSDNSLPIKKVTPSVSIDLLKKQDVVAKKNGIPPIVATLISTQIDLMKDGVWDVVDGDSICRLTIVSKGAPGINLYYDKFSIPAGGKLYIYSADKSQVLGAYTERTNRSGGRFSTEIVYSDSLTLEYVQPAGEVKPEIVISKIGYCYNLSELVSTGNSVVKTSTASSDCYVDVSCSPEGDDWQQQMKGVARLIVPIGAYAYYCSGSLVNNVNQDKTPYFLSAHHCFDQDGQTADFSSVQFYFNYQSTGCGTSVVSSKAVTMVGADLLVDIPLDGGSDGTLLRLKDSIPDAYDVYYNGWDVTTEPPTSGVAIHHPGGELKKISTYTTAATSISVVDVEGDGAEDAHWNIVYAETTNGYSVTAGGSSGCSLFNQDGRIVGTLTGGLSYCDTPTEPDYYGKFYYHWNKYADSTQWMSKYLNPLDYPVTGINGTSVVGDTIKTANVVTISPIIFDDYLYVTTTYVLKEMNVYSLSGRLMASSSTSPVDTRSWPQGIYIVVATTSGGKGKAKVLKK